MSLKDSSIFFCYDLSLQEAETMMRQTQPIRLLIAVDELKGFAVAWRIPSNTSPLKIAWSPNLSGPFHVTTIKSYKKKKKGRGSQDPLDKLFNFLFRFPTRSFVEAMHGAVNGTIPHTHIKPDVIETAKYFGLSPYTLVEYLLEAGLVAHISLKRLAMDLGFSPDVANKLEDVVETIDLWKQVQLAMQEAARQANLITPHQVAAALGLGNKLSKNANLEELIALLRDEK